MPKFKILKDFDGFAKGQVQTFVGQKFIDKMNAGYGEPLVEPKPKTKIKQPRGKGGKFKRKAGRPRKSAKGK